VEHQWAAGSKQTEIFSSFEEAFRAKTRDEWCGQLRKLDMAIEVLPEAQGAAAFHKIVPAIL